MYALVALLLVIPFVVGAPAVSLTSSASSGASSLLSSLDSAALLNAPVALSSSSQTPKVNLTTVYVTVTNNAACKASPTTPASISIADLNANQVPVTSVQYFTVYSTQIVITYETIYPSGKAASSGVDPLSVVPVTKTVHVSNVLTSTITSAPRQTVNINNQIVSSASGMGSPVLVQNHVIPAKVSTITQYITVPSYVTSYAPQSTLLGIGTHIVQDSTITVPARTVYTYTKTIVSTVANIVTQVVETTVDPATTISDSSGLPSAVQNELTSSVITITTVVPTVVTSYVPATTTFQAVGVYFVENIQITIEVAPSVYVYQSTVIATQTVTQIALSTVNIQRSDNSTSGLFPTGVQHNEITGSRSVVTVTQFRPSVITQFLPATTTFLDPGVFVVQHIDVTVNIAPSVYVYQSTILATQTITQVVPSTIGIQPTNGVYNGSNGSVMTITSYVPSVRTQHEPCTTTILQTGIVVINAQITIDVTIAPTIYIYETDVLQTVTVTSLLLQTQTTAIPTNGGLNSNSTTNGTSSVNSTMVASTTMPIYRNSTSSTVALPTITASGNITKINGASNQTFSGNLTSSSSLTRNATTLTTSNSVPWPTVLTNTTTPTTNTSGSFSSTTTITSTTWVSAPTRTASVSSSFGSSNTSTSMTTRSPFSTTTIQASSSTHSSVPIKRNYFQARAAKLTQLVYYR